MSLVEGIFGRVEGECVSGNDVRSRSAQGSSLCTLTPPLTLVHHLLSSAISGTVAGIIFGLV